MTPDLKSLLHLIDEGFDKPAWHGPNLIGSLRGLTLPQLLFRPGPGAHNAWELALHCAYWKHVSRNRLVAGERPPFSLEGSNFFVREGNLSVADWKKDLALLRRAHRELRAAILGLTIRNLDAKTLKSRHSYRRAILGIAAHDIYHAGQIGLLKRLAA
jgi:hypothetical protein